MQINKISQINSKNFSAQNNEKSSPGLQRRKIIESSGMGVGLGLIARAGGSAKEALIAGVSVGLLHYLLNDWDNDIYDKYKSPEEKTDVKLPDKSDKTKQDNSFAPLMFGTLVFLVSAGTGAVISKGKELKKIITRSCMQALGIVGAVHIAKSSIDGIKSRRAANQEQGAAP